MEKMSLLLLYNKHPIWQTLLLAAIATAETEGHLR